MRERVSAVIIKNKKLLVVSIKGDIFWTPGGRIEPGETKEECLKRELKEELGVELTSVKHYFDFELEAEPVDGHTRHKSYCYFVEYEGEPKPNSEIKIIQYVGKKDFITGKIPITSGSKRFLMPKLIESRLI